MSEFRESNAQTALRQIKRCVHPDAAIRQGLPYLKVGRVKIFQANDIPLRRLNTVKVFELSATHTALVPKTERIFLLIELIRNAKIAAVNGKMLVLLIKFAEMVLALFKRALVKRFTAIKIRDRMKW